MTEYELNTKGSAWIMANAGSGKTYVLARRVVQLLLAGAAPESIVCLTYTKAAASEMHQRILLLLKELAIHTGGELVSKLDNILGEPPTDAQLQIAPSLLDRVLDSPIGGLTITTLHGFCQGLLRSFPLEAGISPHAVLMDDGEQAELVSQAIRKLYVSDDAILTKSLGFMAEMVSEERLNQWLARLIYQRNEWQSLIQLPTHEAMKAAIESRASLASYDAAYWQTQLRATPNETLKAAAALLATGSATQQQMSHKLAQWLEGSLDDDEYIAIWLTQAQQPRKNITKPFEKQPALAASIAQEQSRVYDIAQAMSIIASAEETYHMAVLARTVGQLYAQAKQLRNAMDYDDLIARVEHLFARDLPWVMTKLDYRIDHLLLDEAQDTSPAQWRLTEALVRELFSVETPQGAARSLFVVGDEKQSIYSFQGAAPEMFARMREVWSNAITIHSRTRMKSYRSIQAILDLASKVCGVSHSLHRDGEGGKIELWPLVEQPESIENEPYSVSEPTDQQSRAEAMLALQIAGTIHSWLSEKRLLVSRGREVKAGDIMILVHRRKPMTPLLIRELQQLNIPVAGIDRLALTSHLAVKDMIALMRWIVTAEDDLALAQILRSPLIGWSEQELLKHCHGRGRTSLWQHVSHLEHLQRWRAMRDVTPYQLLHELLEVEQRRHDYAARFGHEIHEVLDALLEHAFGYESESVSLLSYSQQLEDSAREIKRETIGGVERDEVRVMTVHGAKGLEAPIVILADTTTVPDLRKEMWYEGPTVALSDSAKNAAYMEELQSNRRDALLAEYNRLLYVAITRAEDELYITGAKPSRRKIEHSWYSTCLNALEQLEGVKSDAGLYVLESPQKKKVHAPIQKQITPIELPEWAHHPAPSETKEAHFSPSRLANSELALYEKGTDDARSRGVIIHRLLELASGASDMKLLTNLLAQLAPDWNSEKQQEIVKHVHSLLTHSDYRWIWNETGYNEVSISGSIMVNGQAKPMVGQIDRLVVRDKDILILDYKTSANVPKQLADTSMTYVLQMKAYAELLAQKYADKTIHCALLWTHAPRLDILDEIVAQTSWDSFRKAA